MRIASYNIMSGGFNSYEYQTKRPQRLPEIKQALKEIDADIVGLVDTFRWDEIFTNDDLQSIFGYKYAFCINLQDERLQKLGHNNGLTILSNTSLICKTVRLGTRNAIAADVIIDGKKTTIFLVYLDDLSEVVRLQQLAVLKELALDKSSIIMGDLNIIAKQDIPEIEESLITFYAKNPTLKHKIEPVITDMFKGEAAAEISSWGMRDACVPYQPTFPTHVFPAYADKAFLRLDYCYYSPQLVIEDFTVMQAAVFQKASDHFPIVFDVKS